jgi:hypothetical protein
MITRPGPQVLPPSPAAVFLLFLDLSHTETGCSRLQCLQNHNLLSTACLADATCSAPSITFTGPGPVSPVCLSGWLIRPEMHELLHQEPQQLQCYLIIIIIIKLPN